MTKLKEMFKEKFSKKEQKGWGYDPREKDYKVSLECWLSWSSRLTRCYRSRLTRNPSTQPSESNSNMANSSHASEIQNPDNQPVPLTKTAAAETGSGSHSKILSNFDQMQIKGLGRNSHGKRQMRLERLVRVDWQENLDEAQACFY